MPEDNAVDKKAVSNGIPAPDLDLPVRVALKHRALSH
jgi:hypothetical protein